MAKPTKHVITASKGGLGKTIFSLAANSSLIGMGRRTAVIDANPCNQDASSIYSTLPVLWKDDNPTLLYQRRALQLRDGEPYGFLLLTPMRTPKTAEELWRLIGGVESHEQDLDAIVVDTNFHIYQLLTEKPGDVPPLTRVNIWYLWSWTTPASHRELRRVDEAVQRLTRDFRANILHVFNIYALYGTAFVEIIKTSRGKRVVKPLKEVVDAFSRREGDPWSVPWKQLKLLADVLGRSILSYDDLPIEKVEERIPVLWKQLFLDLLDTCPEGHTPDNLLVIPDYYESIVNIRDKLTLMRPTSIDEINDAIAPIKHHVQRLFLHSARLSAPPSKG